MGATPIAIATILGTIIGGIAGALKNRADHKRGVRADDREDLTSQQDRYERILDRVTQRMEALESDVRELHKENSDIRKEMRGWRSRYFVALDFIQALTRWIAQHVAADGETPPVAPDIIMNDL